MNQERDAELLFPSEDQDEPLELLDGLGDDELMAMEELAEAEKLREAELRENLAKVLVKHRDEAIKFRAASGIEAQWAGDQAYYEGEDENSKTMYYKGLTMDSPLIAKPKPKYKSKVFLNITRPYVETAASKVIEVLSPSDEPSWSLEPAKVPNLPERPSPLVEAVEMQQDVQLAQQDPNAPAPAAQPPKETTLEIAAKLSKAACKGAMLWINDKLSQCQFQGTLRAVVDESSRLGTGVVCGPFPMVVRHTKSSVNENKEEVVEVVEELVPTSRKVSVWDVFPDPACGDNIHNGQFFIEHDRMVEKQVRDLKEQPGYIAEAIDFVLAQGPMQDAAGGLVAPPFESQDISARRFHVWYYTGFLARDDVLALGCGCNESDVLPAGAPVIVTMINDTPVKAHLNPDPKGRFPYDFMCWQAVAGSPFGIGIARQIRSCQAILNSHVRAMMENAGLSSGPQIVISRGAVHPADGSWEITPRKVWLLKPDADIQDVSKAMSAFLIPSVQADLLAAINFALQMAENVTGLPILLQGQQGPNGVPETVGGMQILVANASSLLRRIARIYDDHLITPHIRAYYEWMMNYAEDDSIKGDFKVIAHGSTALVARDQRNIFLSNVVPQFMANPDFGIDPSRYFKKVAKINHFSDPDEIMFSPGEIAVLQQQRAQAAAQDPRIQVAGIQSQTRLQVAEMANETDQLRVQRDRDRDQVYVEAEAQRTLITHQAKIAEMQLRRELLMLELAQRDKLSLDTIRAQLAITAGNHDLQRELAALPTVDQIAATLGNSESDAPDVGGAAPVGQQATASLIEPAGRAPAGMADSL